MRAVNIFNLRLRRRPQDFELAKFKNNDKISKLRMLTARALGARINNAVRDRQAIVSSSPDIDPDFAMPAANWDSPANDHLKNYRLLASLTPEEIRALRFRSQNFTGNNLKTMSHAVPGSSGSDSIPDGVEARWAEKIRDQVVAHWNAITRDIAANRILSAPNILGEVGWWYDGRILNVDMNDYQERMSLLSLSGVLDRFGDQSPRILEIGGGYGALCLGLLTALKPSQYVICDLPESLLFSGLYLKLASRNTVRIATRESSLEPETEGEICLLPNSLAEVLMPTQSFDLVINTLSMSEMSPHQVETYGAMVSKAIGSSGIFFEQNQSNKHLGLIDCRDYLPRFFRDQRIIEPNIPTTRGAAIIWAN